MPSLPSVGDRLVRSESKGQVAEVVDKDPFRENIELYWGTIEPGAVGLEARRVTETISFETCYREFEQAS